MDKIENSVTFQDILINKFAEEIAKGIKNYLIKSKIKENEIEIDMSIENVNPYEMKVYTTIHRKKLEMMKN